MTENVLSLASAVAIPDSEQLVSTPDQTTSLKRRQSELSEGLADAKRARLSSENHEAEQRHASPQAAEGVSPADAAIGAVVNDEGQVTRRRKTGRDEERKRGQRMFGVLLGALSSSGAPEKTAKRRADIEKRQAEKLRQLEEDFSQREREQAEVLTRIRRKEQWVVDDAAMRIRHANNLARARFLSTKTEPTLYYKPWDLLDEEEDQIGRQIEEAEDKIEREIDEFEQRRNAALAEEAERDTNGHTEDHGDTIADSELPTEESKMTTAISEQPEDPNIVNSTKLLKDEDAQEDQRDDSHLDDEHHGETVVEAEEDTVIY